MTPSSRMELTKQDIKNFKLNVIKLLNGQIDTIPNDVSKQEIQDII